MEYNLNLDNLVKFRDSLPKPDNNCSFRPVWHYVLMPKFNPTLKIPEYPIKDDHLVVQLEWDFVKKNWKLIIKT